MWFSSTKNSGVSEGHRIGAPWKRKGIHEYSMDKDEKPWVVHRKSGS